MGTIAEKIGYLNETKNAIKNALINKGVEVSDSDTFRSYADKISEISSGGGTDMLQARVDETKSCAYLFHYYTGKNPDIVKNLNTTSVKNMSYMFNNCSSLTSLDVSNLDTSSVTNMSYMFQSCTKLPNPDLSKFNTTSVTNMNGMFKNCRGLTSLDLSNFDTSSVTNMGSMFYDCVLLENIIFSNSFVTSNVTDMRQMFNNCGRIITLDLSSFNTSNVTDMHQTFVGCSKLETIIGELDLISNVYSDLFSNCRALTTAILKNIKKTLTIGSGTSYGTLLTDDTIVNTFKELHDLTGSTTQTLTLSTPSGARTEAIYVKLIDVTDEMRAEDQYIDNKKPCIVCESIDEGAMTLKEYGISKNWNISY